MKINLGILWVHEQFWTEITEFCFSSLYLHNIIKLFFLLDIIEFVIFFLLILTFNPSNETDWSLSPKSRPTTHHPQNHIKTILLLLAFFLSLYNNWLFTTWTFLPDPRHRLNLEPCHLKLQDTSLLIWMLSAGVWIKESMKMDREEVIRRCTSGSDLGNCDCHHFDIKNIDS